LNAGAKNEEVEKRWGENAITAHLWKSQKEFISECDGYTLQKLHPLLEWVREMVSVAWWQKFQIAFGKAGKYTTWKLHYQEEVYLCDNLQKSI
jgi:hypothetical protein